MPMMNLGHVVVEILQAEGVKAFFGLPGGHTLSIYDGLYQTPQIRNILVRHEHAAASMAAAYAQLTGEPGICCATAGPGATNIVTGIAEAFYGALPVIALTGRGSTRDTLRGSSQEIPQEKLFAPITKWAVRVERADMVPEILRHAFKVARTGKPGPVLIDFPKDILLGASIDFSGYVPVGKPSPPRADPQTLNAAATALLAAKRPIIVAGGGAVMSGAFSQLRSLAERLALPVLTTLSGRGALADDHPLACGGLGMHRNALSKKMLGEADFVLGLGCRFEQMETNWLPGFVPPADACYVQVDTDPAEIGKSVIPRIGILSDIGTLLEDMLTAVRQLNGPDYGTDFGDLPRIKAVTELKKQVEAGVSQDRTSTAIPLSPMRVVREIRDYFPRETTVAVDVGNRAQALGGAFPYCNIYEPRSIIPCTSFYGMGYAAAAAPVAKLVYPDRPAIALCGDGSFQMVMHILPVAVEYNLPITWCILNDSALGSIQWVQDKLFPNRPFSTAFAFQPDFAGIAKACGCHGEKVTQPDQIKAAAHRAMDANNRGIPAVLDFVIASTGPAATEEYFAAR